MLDLAGALAVENLQDVFDSFAHVFSEELILTGDHASFKHWDQVWVIHNDSWRFGMTSHDRVDEVEQVLDNVSLLTEPAHQTKQQVLVI